MTLQPGGRAISLMYHDVVANGDVGSSGFAGSGADIYKLDRDEFARHLDGIGDVPQIIGENHQSRAGVHLTFDDGGESAHSIIAPMLERRGWRGHFFITTDRIGTSGFVDADQIRDLAKRGHVIGSHSCSHPKRISSCSADELRHEWEGSVEILSDLLRSRVTVASVPGGFYSSAVGGSAARAGIAVLFTSEPTPRIGSVDGCLLLGRYGIWRGMPPSTSGAIASGAWLPRWKQSTWWTIKKAAKSIPGNPYARLRSVLLRGRE